MDQDKNNVINPKITGGIFPHNALFFTATEAKNELSHIMEKVNVGHSVIITKHKIPKAVIISVEDFNEFIKEMNERDARKLDAMRKRFDDLIANMQSPETEARVQAFFDATPEQLGKTALESVIKETQKQPGS